MQSELYPELLFYIHEEGTLGALQFSATGQEEKRSEGSVGIVAINSL